MVELTTKGVVGTGEMTTFKQVCRRRSFSFQFSPCFSANYVGADSVKPLGASPAKGLFQLGL